MKRLLGILCLCGAALLAAPAALAADGKTTLLMEFFYGDVKAADMRVEITFADDGAGGETYHIVSHGKAVGLAKLLYGDTHSESRGRVDKTHGLLMTLYTEKRGKRKPQRAELRGDQLHLQRGDDARVETVDAPVFDTLSAIYRSFALGRAAAGKVKFTNGWRLTDYDYDAAGTETVQTGLGEVESALIERASERGARKMWLAPSLDYLPARLYVDDKGHEFTTELKAVQREE